MLIEIITKDYGTIISDSLDISIQEAMQGLHDCLSKDGIYFKIPVNNRITIIPSSIMRESIISFRGE